MVVASKWCRSTLLDLCPDCLWLRKPGRFPVSTWFTLPLTSFTLITLVFHWCSLLVTGESESHTDSSKGHIYAFFTGLGVLSLNTPRPRVDQWKPLKVHPSGVLLFCCCFFFNYFTLYFQFKIMSLHFLCVNCLCAFFMCKLVMCIFLWC